MFSERKMRAMLRRAPSLADVVVPKSEWIRTRVRLPKVADLHPRSPTSQGTAPQAYHGHRLIRKGSHHPLPQTTPDLLFQRTYVPRVRRPNLNILGMQTRPMSTTIRTDPHFLPLEVCRTTGPPRTLKSAEFTHTPTRTTCLKRWSTSRILSMNKSTMSTLWCPPLRLGYQAVSLRITNRFSTRPTVQHRPDSIPSLRPVL